MDMDNQNTKIYTDKVLAVTSLLFVFISVAGLAIYSQESIKIAATWMQWTTSVFTTPVLLFAFLAIIFTFGLAFSKYGKIKLGEGKPQYSTMSWIFMFILSGIGSSTLYWGFLDWAEIVQEEIFGPVAPLIRFTDEADVVAQANDTIFGLAAYVYSENISRLWRVSEQLEYGMVGMNATAISNEVVPFGGVKQSGVGREGSKYGLEEFMTIKYMCLGL
ncbi:aldehyde dehydrogenase family protein [Acinetobacter nosocomialis]|uniref:aldehyde dehydrogenase family protein n=1 Tax=Acinetobacter nosocomialis TaxID=106654 RepID=UPI0009BCC647|nr:aldehyde dehydrogenase family protein [Acinetobacter nosocomialis]